MSTGAFLMWKVVKRDPELFPSWPESDTDVHVTNQGQVIITRWPLAAHASRAGGTCPP